MNAMLKYTKLLLLCLCVAAFSSCEDDDDYVYDNLVRYQWIGDLGFYDRFGEPLESGLLLEPNGFGTDEQYYYDGTFVTELPISWNLSGGILSLNYGFDYPLLEIYDVYIFGDELSGVLYVDGYRDGPITLYR